MTFIMGLITEIILLGYSYEITIYMLIKHNSKITFRKVMGVQMFGYIVNISILLFHKKIDYKNLELIRISTVLSLILAVCFLILMISMMQTVKNKNKHQVTEINNTHA